MNSINQKSRHAVYRARMLATLVGCVLALPSNRASAASGNVTADAEIIHACFVPQSGTLYRIKATDPAETCKSPQHVAIQWNITGPVGPEGLPGVAGPAGPSGPQGSQGPVGPVGPVGNAGAQGATGGKGALGPIGPNGVVGIEVVKVTEPHDFIVVDHAATATCPAGKKVIAGGYAVVPSVGRVTISRPELDNQSWYIYADRLGGNSPDISVYAICAPWP